MTVIDARRIVSPLAGRNRAAKGAGLVPARLTFSKGVVTDIS